MSQDTFVVLTGGIGGAKLCLGLQRILPATSLRIVVNTGDDFEHLGLCISPDVDTTLYTLAGLSNRELGWGREDETWTFMKVLESLGGETWFRLGDGDLALHVERTQRLREGESLSTVTTRLAQRLRIEAEIIPASDDVVRTRVITSEGELGFQEYFVRRRCAPAVHALRFAGAESAKVAPAILDALKDSHLRGIVVAPSNPYLSIDPILTIPFMSTQLRSARVPIIAVTPIIGDLAVKGPTAKIMRELGIVPSPLAVIEHYHGLIDGFVLDEKDADLASRVPLPVKVCNTLMVSLEDRDRVARAVLDLIQQLS